MDSHQNSKIGIGLQHEQNVTKLNPLSSSHGTVNSLGRGDNFAWGGISPAPPHYGPALVSTVSTIELILNIYLYMLVITCSQSYRIWRFSPNVRLSGFLKYLYSVVQNLAQHRENTLCYVLTSRYLQRNKLAIVWTVQCRKPTVSGEYH